MTGTPVINGRVHESGREEKPSRFRVFSGADSAFLFT
jgi:hypothetical protein